MKKGSSEKEEREASSSSYKPQPTSEMVHFRYSSSPPFVQTHPKTSIASIHQQNHSVTPSAAPTPAPPPKNQFEVYCFLLDPMSLNSRFLLNNMESSPVPSVLLCGAKTSSGTMRELMPSLPKALVLLLRTMGMSRLSLPHLLTLRQLPTTENTYSNVFHRTATIPF